MKKNHSSPRNASTQKPTPSHEVKQAEDQQKPLIETDPPEFDDYNISERATRKHSQRKFSPRYDKKTPSVATRIFSWLFALIFLAISGILVYTLYRYSILPGTLRLIISAILLVINIIFFSLVISGGRRKALAKTAIIMSLIFSIILGSGGYYLLRGIFTIDELNKNTNVRTTDMGIVVLKDAPVNDLEDLRSVKILAPTKTDGLAVSSYLADIKKRADLNLETENVENYIAASDKLLSKEAKAMVLNKSWLPSILEVHPDFSELTREIDTTVLSREVKDVTKDVDTERTSFNIYISGIDTYGDISTVSRSDVNIIMTMNPSTRQMLLTSVPRDTYVSIQGGGEGHMDKLTHAGIYGVESSIETLEKFLDTDINYYVRVNFTSLISIVDEIGGVDVDNPVSFSTRDYDFPAGTVHLDGKHALAFSRERYNLASGDFDRGRNQERVILAMFHKLTSPELLKNYNSILENVSSSIQTNMPTEAIMGVANSMLDNPGPWSTEMIDVKGRGNPALRSYLIPDRDIYLMEPYPDSVAEVKEKIKEVLDATPETVKTTASETSAASGDGEDSSDSGDSDGGNE